MRSVVVVSGVLGVGTAVVFALAAMAASMFPDGGTVMSGWNGSIRNFGGGVVVDGPVPAPVIVNDQVIDAGPTIGPSIVPDSPPPSN